MCLQHRIGDRPLGRATRGPNSSLRWDERSPQLNAASIGNCPHGRRSARRDTRIPHTGYRGMKSPTDERDHEIVAVEVSDVDSSTDAERRGQKQPVQSTATATNPTGRRERVPRSDRVRTLRDDGGHSRSRLDDSIEQEMPGCHRTRWRAVGSVASGLPVTWSDKG